MLSEEEVRSRKRTAAAVAGHPTRMRRLLNALAAPKTSFARVAANKLTAECIAGARHALDNACVRAALSLNEQPFARIGGRTTRLRYFEVKIDRQGGLGTAPRISIGLAPASWAACAALGTEEGGVAYRCDSGHIHLGRVIGEDYGPACTTGDVIGVAYDAAAREVWFTRNGEKLAAHRGAAGRDVGVLHPAASMHTVGERVKFDFDGPFRFDLSAYVVDAAPVAIPSPVPQRLPSLPVDTSVMDGVVADFLLHYGYTATYDALRRSVQRRSTRPRPTPVDTPHDAWSTLSYDDLVAEAAGAVRTSPPRSAARSTKLTSSSSSSASTPQLPVQASTPVPTSARTPGAHFITSPLTPSLAALSSAGLGPGLVSTPYFRARTGSGIPGSAT